MATCQFRESFLTAAIGNMIKTLFLVKNYPEDKITILAHEITCECCTQYCATGLHLQCDCQERRTDTLRWVLYTTLRTDCHTSE